MKISEKLFMLRTENRMTQDEFAKISGASSKAISTWEKGKRNPKVQYINSICSHFGMASNVFMDESNDYYKPEENEDAAEKERLLEMYRTRPEMRMFFSLAEDATAEDIKTAAAIIETLRKNRE